MVGKAPVRIDRSRPGFRGDRRGRDLVVDPPSDVLCPRLPAVRPPRVAIRARINPAEDIDEPELVEHAREPRTLLGQEAGILLIAAPVPEIDLAVRDVPVAAEDDLSPGVAQL